jgi:hypothetical protein
VGFLDPKQRNDEDEALPGATGLHLDLDLKRCPSCRREVDPWRTECPDCGVVPVASTELPGADFPLPPGLRDLADETTPDETPPDED